MLKANLPYLNVEQLDSHLHLLGVKNGILDIDTMTLVPNGSSHLITKRIGAVYDPNATCPHFDRFLESIFPDKTEMEYVLASLGYALSGEANLRSMFIWFGSGANGKSTLLETVAHVFGDYSVTLEPKSFIKKVGNSISNDIARLRGARLCVTSETSAGDILDASLVKRMTGNDTLSARFLYQENFEFENKAIVFLTSNFIPVFDGSDKAFTARIKLIPFHVTIPENQRNPSLPSKLREEASGILNRLLEGYQAYKKMGLVLPDRFKEMTDKVCLQSNLIRQFIEEHLNMSADTDISAARLYSLYVSWAQGNNYKPLSQNVFTSVFEAETQKLKKRTSQGMVWEAIKIKSYPSTLTQL